MRRALQYIEWVILRFLLWLRYRIKVHGKEKMRGLKGPVLVLPNHPGYIDPILVFAGVWPWVKIRPMVYAGNLGNPIIYGIVKTFHGIEIPDLEQASANARSQIEAGIQAIIDGLKQGGAFVLWPAGHVERDGVERLGPTRAASDILKAVPETTVILVRTRGLWGSLFTYAQTGSQPPLGSGVLRGFLKLLLSLLFFAPRRRVDMTVEVFKTSDMPGLNREVLNPWLEKWYNVGSPEKPTWVPYHWFDRRTFNFPPPPPPEQFDYSRVKPSTIKAVEELLAAHVERPLSDEEKKPETRLAEIGLDSIDRMDLNLEVEKRFGFTGDVAAETVGELWLLASGLSNRKPPRPPDPLWFRKLTDDGPLTIHGDTLAEAFVHRALSHPKDPAAADDMAGVLSYEKLLIGALLMTKRFRKIEAPNVGLLMPASIGGDLALLGLLLAGKVPVILNWTTGKNNLAHAVRVMQLTHVVTSKAFLDRAHVEVPGVEYILLEGIRQGIGWFEKLRSLLRVRWFKGSVRRAVPKVSPDQPAVVLFTSGSEKAPKAVPLTHTNILADQRACLAVMGLTRKDVLMGFLPSFHSFGLTVTGLLPLFTGFRVVRHPDPTDAGNLAQKIIGYKVSILPGTPTFVNYIVERAKPGEMTSPRLIIVGAEKCPPIVFDLCKKAAPNAVVAEGYGITECSPVVSVNPPEAPRPGSIGKPLPGVEVIAVDLESDEKLPTGQMGMLLVSGPTVFPGYLGHEGASPFIERDGKRWYVTGDLGEFDEDGYLWFKGRLKRFLKAGGEMISLPALEEPFAELFPATQDGPRVAVEGVELDDGRRIVLFTTEPITLREANELLSRHGFHGVLRLDEVRRVEKIPVLGTGKTDYKVLRAQILEALQPQHS